jgi:hypothetical protein
MGSIVFTLAGALLAWLAALGSWRKSIRQRIDADRSLAWERGEGRITRSELEKDSDSDGTSYRLDIRYTYEVRGIEYYGHRAYFGDREWSPRADEPRDMVGRYEVGKTVPIYFDPASPGQAVLIRGDKTGVHLSGNRAVFGVAIGAVFFAAFLWKLVVFLR